MLEGLGSQLEPGEVDHVVGTPLEVEEPVLHPSEVVGLEPRILVDQGDLLAIDQRGGGQVRAADPDAPVLADGYVDLRVGSSYRVQGLTARRVDLEKRRA